jgi:hypothetical protein
MDLSVAVALALTLTDMGQTLDIARYPAHPAAVGQPACKWRYEANPLLGARPAPVKVVGYFGTGMATLAVAHYKLPAPWGDRFAYATIGVEGAVVAHNIHMGMAWRF